jgi:hypothetical protein
MKRTSWDKKKIQSGKDLCSLYVMLSNLDKDIHKNENQACEGYKAWLKESRHSLKLLKLVIRLPVEQNNIRNVLI